MRKACVCFFGMCERIWQQLLLDYGQRGAKGSVAGQKLSHLATRPVDIAIAWFVAAGLMVH